MSDDDTLRLNNQLCFALYAAANAITRNYRGMLGEFGLTYPQFLVVMTLLETPSMTSGDLARRLRLDAGTLTPMLKRLATAGIIERTRRPDDERVIDNRLTEAGLALRDNMVRTQATVQCNTGLTDHDLADLRERLKQLTETLMASLTDAAESNQSDSETRRSAMAIA
jgi:DNA-binding MarR family transcriptional regulator